MRKKGRCNRRYRIDLLRTVVDDFFDRPSFDLLEKIDLGVGKIFRNDTEKAGEKKWTQKEWGQTYEALFFKRIEYLCDGGYVSKEEIIDGGMRLCIMNDDLKETLSDRFGELVDSFEFAFDEEGLSELHQILMVAEVLVIRRYEESNPEHDYEQLAQEVMRSSRSLRVKEDGKQLPYRYSDKEATQIIDSIQESLGISE